MIALPKEVACLDEPGEVCATVHTHSPELADAPLVLTGAGLTIAALVQVARHERRVALTTDERVRAEVGAARAIATRLRFDRTIAGATVRASRAAVAVRANVLLRAASGAPMETIVRLHDALAADEPELVVDRNEAACLEAAETIAAAALRAYDAQRLIALSLGALVLAAQAAASRTDALDPFIHAHRPHRGQRWVARNAWALVNRSRLTTDGDRLPTEPAERESPLFAIAQRLGPVAEAIADVKRDMQVEINSTSEDHLVDIAAGRVVHGANADVQYVTMGMERLRTATRVLSGVLDDALAALGVYAGVHVEPEMDTRLPDAVRSTRAAARAIEAAERRVVLLLDAAGLAIERRASLDRRGRDASALLSPGTRPLHEAIGRVTRWVAAGDDARAAMLGDIRADGAIVAAIAPVMAGLDALSAGC